MTPLVMQAIDRFTEGFSCSQAVFVAFAEHHGLEKDAALRIADAFGGGMGRMGLSCGAVTGALMAIGLLCGRTEPGDDESKRRTVDLSREFIRTFEARHDSLVCRELLGVDISTDEGYARAHGKNLIRTVCPAYIASAVEMLECMLEERERR